jgi:hypothetical protein
MEAVQLAMTTMLATFLRPLSARYVFLLFLFRNNPFEGVPFSSLPKRGVSGHMVPSLPTIHHNLLFGTERLYAALALAKCAPLMGIERTPSARFAQKLHSGLISAFSVFQIPIL